jgi:hexosaminidase
MYVVRCSNARVLRSRWPAHVVFPGGVRYCTARGVRLLAEIDTPGHGASWCVGMPHICPSPSCLQPLRPDKNDTFQAIGAVLKDLFTVLSDDFVHLGGDEADTSCWGKSPEITAWMASQNLTLGGAFNYFTARTRQLAALFNKTAIVWDEVFTANGPERLDPSRVVMNTRFNKAQAPARIMIVANATAHHFRVIRSENKFWYLDQTIHKPWTDQYEFEPCGDIPPESCKFIIGGAGSQWGETADTSDLMQTIWPRAGAIGERLWSPRHVNDSADALPRYVQFRCLLNRRGFAAAPALNSVARSAPDGPGSCYTQ